MLPGSPALLCEPQALVTQHTTTQPKLPVNETFWMAALLGAEPGLKYLHTYTPAKTALFFFGKKAIWAVSVDFLSEPEASRNKSNLPKSLVFPGCLLLGKVARASLLSMYLEKYNGISAQLSTIRKKAQSKWTEKVRGRQTQRTETLCCRYTWSVVMRALTRTAWSLHRFWSHRTF